MPIKAEFTNKNKMAGVGVAHKLVKKSNTNL